jgi:prevent-host-death family protein
MTNQVLDAKEAKQQFGQLITKAQKEPVTVRRNGVPCVIVMSIEDYEHFLEMENELMLYKAKKEDKKSEYLGAKKTKDFLKSI